MNDEVWVVIDEAPRYLVSNHGRVLNGVTDRIMRIGYAGRDYDIGGGYEVVNLTVANAQTKMFYVHILVANAFCPGYRAGLEVNHIDTDKHNNYARNLEWVTHKRNMEHASHHGLLMNSGTEKTRIRIIETGEEFESQHECARHIGGRQSSIWMCLNGQRKRHLGLTFEYV